MLDDQDGAVSHFDWLWSRSVGRDVEVSVADPAALAILNDYEWRYYISRDEGLKYRTVYNIKTGHTWAHIEAAA